MVPSDGTEETSSSNEPGREPFDEDQEFNDFVNADTVIPIRRAEEEERQRIAQQEGVDMAHVMTDSEREQIRLLIAQSKRLTDAVTKLTDSLTDIRREVNTLKAQAVEHARFISDLQVSVKGITQAVRRIEQPMRHIQASLAALGAKLDDNV